MCLKRHNWVFESFSRLTLRLKSKQVAYSKLRIYGLANRGIACYKLRIYELRDSWSVCDKAYFWPPKFRPLRINPWIFSFKSSSFISPTHSIPYPARHIPSFRRAVVSLLLLPFPLTSPPFGGAWGGSFSLVLGRFSFLSFASFCQILSLSFFNLRPFAL